MKSEDSKTERAVDSRSQIRTRTPPLNVQPVQSITAMAGVGVGKTISPAGGVTQQYLEILDLAILRPALLLCLPVATTQ